MSQEPIPSFGAFSTLEQSFRVLFSDIKFFAAILLLYTLISAVPYLFIFDGIDFSDPQVILEMAQTGNVLFGILTLIYYLLYAFMFVVVLDKTNATLNGLDFDEYPYVNRAFKTVLPVVLIYISTIIGVTLGLLLLIIPGLIVIAGLYIATPVKLAENISFDQALLRSWSMTKGRRLSIWGIILIPLVPMMIITFGLMGVLAVQVLGDGGIEAVISPTVLIINYLLSGSFTIFYMIAAGVAYQLIKNETAELEKQ